MTTSSLQTWWKRASGTAYPSTLPIHDYFLATDMVAESIRYIIALLPSTLPIHDYFLSTDMVAESI
jgi:hypothetical protein